jgi:hypothetical protein
MLLSTGLHQALSTLTASAYYLIFPSANPPTCMHSLDSPYLDLARLPGFCNYVTKQTIHPCPPQVDDHASVSGLMLAIHQQLGVPLEDMALSLDPQLLVAKDGAGIKCAGGKRGAGCREGIGNHVHTTAAAITAAKGHVSGPEREACSPLDQQPQQGGSRSFSRAAKTSHNVDTHIEQHCMIDRAQQGQQQQPWQCCKCVATPVKLFRGCRSACLQAILVQKPSARFGQSLAGSSACCTPECLSHTVISMLYCVPVSTSVGCVGSMFIRHQLWACTPATL